MTDERTTPAIAESQTQSPVRIAYFLTSRELANEEPIADPRRFPEVNLTHRGNLPRVTAMINQGMVGHAQLALVVMDDDRPHRDFADLGIPVHVEPSSAFKTTTKRGTPERDAAKAQYEDRLVERLSGAAVDFIVSDRYMTIHGPVMLDAYEGLITNTHPARLPGLEGATPTADALRRAREKGIWVHGNTFHIVDNHIDTGPPIRQIELTPIYPNDSHWDLRARNYGHEAMNIGLGLAEYLMDPLVQELITLNRLIRTETNGEQAKRLEQRQAARKRLLETYQSLFGQRLETERLSPSPHGSYIYSARAQAMLPLPEAFRLPQGERRAPATTRSR